MTRHDYIEDGYRARYARMTRRDCAPRGGWQRAYWMQGYGRAAKELLHPTLYLTRAFQEKPDYVPMMFRHVQACHSQEHFSKEKP